MTPYDRLVWSDAQVEHWLVHDEHKRELIVWFGQETWAEFTVLAKAAHASRAADRGRPRPLVWLVPGIMGTQLGRPRAGSEVPDVLWLDPVDVMHGRLTELRHHEHDGIRSFGVLLHSHLRLKLRLVAAGYEVRFFDYDWRLPFGRLGASFAAALRAEPRSGAIVAYSMGGLVARAALAIEPAPWLERIVLLGTPNQGAHAALQALRGTYPVVRRLAMLDGARSAEQLATEVFATLPSLHELLPFAAFGAELDLRSAANWPAEGPGAQRALLEDAGRSVRTLAAADSRYVAIAGVGARTVTAAHRTPRGFAYRYALAGDGTVALRSALLDGVPTWAARADHSQLTRDPLIARAIVDLLVRGRSDELPAAGELEPAIASEADAEEHADDALRTTLTGKLDWAALGVEERRRFLEALNEPALPR